MLAKQSSKLYFSLKNFQLCFGIAKRNFNGGVESKVQLLKKFLVGSSYQEVLTNDFKAE